MQLFLTPNPQVTCHCACAVRFWPLIWAEQCILVISTCLHISKTSRARDLKFGTQTHSGNTSKNGEENPEKGRDPRSSGFNWQPSGCFCGEQPRTTSLSPDNSFIRVFLRKIYNCTIHPPFHPFPCFLPSSSLAPSPFSGVRGYHPRKNVWN